MSEKTLRQRWIEALRSGEYKQGHYRLKCEGRYCCLGVLAELAGKLEEQENGEFLAVGAGMASLPHEVIGNQSIFWDMNDSWGKTFAEIADYIEAHPEIDPVWPPEVT